MTMTPNDECVRFPDRNRLFRSFVISHNTFAKLLPAFSLARSVSVKESRGRRGEGRGEGRAEEDWGESFSHVTTRQQRFVLPTTSHCHISTNRAGKKWTTRASPLWMWMRLCLPPSALQEQQLRQLLHPATPNRSNSNSNSSSSDSYNKGKT